MQSKLIVPALGNFKVKSNGFFADEFVEVGKPSAYDMFFKSYTSVEEFVFHLRHTAYGAAMIGSAFLPIGLYLGVGIATCIYVAEKFSPNNSYDEQQHNTHLKNVASEIFSSIVQLLVDLVTLPLTLLVMITRGIATAVDYFSSLYNDGEQENNYAQDFNGQLGNDFRPF